MKVIDAIGHLRRFLAPYPFVLPAVAILGTIAAVAEGFSIGLLIPFLSVIMDNEPTGGGIVARIVQDYAALFPPDYQLVGISLSVIAFVIASCTISYAYIRLLAWAATRVSHDIRTQLFRRFFETDDMFLGDGAQARQIKAIQISAYRVGQAVITLCLMLAAICVMIVFCVVLLLISWPMTLMVGLGVAVVGLVLRVAVKHTLTQSVEFEHASGMVGDTALQVVSGVRMVRIFGQEEREAERFEAESERVRRSEYTLEAMRRSMGQLIDGLTVPVLILVFIIATYNGVSAAILLPFLALVFRLQRYVREVNHGQVRLAADAGAVFEIAELLAPRPDAETRQRDGIAPFDGLSRAIAFEDVSFAHPGQGFERAPAVCNVSLTIHRGETIAVVGASGAGKSTMINLLMGLYRPTNGRILVDDVPLARIDPAQWRRRLGFAGQDAELRTGTIGDNIAYGKPDASREDVAHAARQANILTFIEGLPDGFDTKVGTRGLQVSGGERQRIALARALLRRPDILILDEATNAVDNASEAAIQSSLLALKGSLTMVIVAHRLSSIRHADRVVVMEAGRIKEIGEPDELLRAKGTFAELTRLEGIAAE